MVWENRARCVSRQVTRHSLSAHSWDSLAPHPDKPSASSHEKIVVHMSSMNWLSHPVLSSLPIHADNSSFLLSPHFAHGSGAVCLLNCDPRQYVMTTTDKFVGLDDERQEADHTGQHAQAHWWRGADTEGPAQNDPWHCQSVQDQVDERWRWHPANLLQDWRGARSAWLHGSQNPVKGTSSDMAATEAADKTAIPRRENLGVAEAFVFNDSKTDVLKNSNEEGNWSYMREDSSQKGDAEAQRQRASQGQ